MAASASGASARWRAQSLASRVVSSLVLAPVALAAIWAGGLALAAAVLLAALLAIHEISTLAGRAGIPVPRFASLAAGGVVVALAAAPLPVPPGPVLFLTGALLLATSLRPPVEGRLAGAAFALFAVLYVAGLAVHLIWLRRLEGGGSLLLLVVAGTWAADVFAFFVGVLWGRVRIAPHVSPGKSLEGLLGGFAGSIAVVAGGNALLPAPPLGTGAAALLGAVIGIAAPFGDLVESMLKRNLRAKDASHLIPGHGGLLDRIDSLLLAGPASYYLLRTLIP